MKKFKDFCIIGDALQVICTNTETGEDSVGCELDLKPFYFYPDLGLEDNIFSTRRSSGDSTDAAQEEKEEKRRYMNEFFCRVPDAVKEHLDREGIQVVTHDYEELNNKTLEVSLFLEDHFVGCLLGTLHLNLDFEKEPESQMFELEPGVFCGKDELRFSEEDAKLLWSVGIDPCRNVPNEVLQLVKKGCPVLNEEPEFLKKER